MTTIASDWADHYGGIARNFLYDQLRRLSKAENVPGAPAKIDPKTGHVIGADEYAVVEVRVGDRTRFDLVRVGGSALPLEEPPPHPSKIKTGVIHSDWAEDFGHKPENFLRETVRWLHPAVTRTTGGECAGGDTDAAGQLRHAGLYKVDEVSVDGRTRYELRRAAERVDGA